MIGQTEFDKEPEITGRLTDRTQRELCDDLSHDAYRRRSASASTRNPRYFTPPSADGTERAVYLTGSHIWNNLRHRRPGR